ncbi:MAG: YcxB family protein [Planctomycetaceae bacterium]
MAYAAISVGSQHMAMLWLTRVLFGGMTTRAELELDAAGIHGEIRYLSTRFGGNEHKRVNYAWNRLRKVERLPEYLVLEFHGGSQALIPVRAFASSTELDQCEKWVEGGLAQQRRRIASGGV